MRLFLSFLPVLACGGLMYVCMRGMGMGRKDHTEPDAASQIAELRAEVERLRAERTDSVESDKSIDARP